VLIRQQLLNGDTLRYSYDSRLNLVAVQDPTGFVQERTFSAAGDLIAQTSPLSSTSAAVVAFTYDNVHRMVGVTDANGNKTTYTYNGPNLGSLVTAGPPGHQVRTTSGQLTMTTPIGRQTLYDAAGNESKVLETEISGDVNGGHGRDLRRGVAPTSFVDARHHALPPTAFTTQWHTTLQGTC
jgi:YD repeat-containing protein